MNTFLPYADFEKSAQCLDRMRLGKQRVEVLQILRALNGETEGWKNHPAVKMWDGYLEALVEYGISVCTEWISRGNQDGCVNKIMSHSWGNEVVFPHWFGDESFHLAHRSNLIRKLPEHYGPLWPDVPSDLPYVWPDAALLVNPATPAT